MYRKNTSFWGHSKQKCMIIYQQMMIFLSTLPYRDCRAPCISSLLALKNNYYNKRRLFLLSTEEARELLRGGGSVNGD